MAELGFVERTFVNFRDHAFPGGEDHGFRWVDLKSFHFPRDCPDPELLAAVVAHEQFRDDYAAGGADPDGLLHGPYWLHAVSAGDYRPIGHDRAALVLEAWVKQYSGLPHSLEDTLDATLRATVNSADRLYRLRDLGSGALHDWGGVHDEFHEFVAINDDRQSLTLIVTADD